MTDTMHKFLAAAEHFETQRKAWNALPTPEARHSSGVALDPDNIDETALAFIADAAGRHKVEERAVVYLVLGATGWEIDSTTWSGPLEGYDDGALDEACEHEDGLDDECSALVKAANWIAIPDAFDLTSMLMNYRGDTNG